MALVDCRLAVLIPVCCQLPFWIFEARPLFGLLAFGVQVVLQWPASPLPVASLPLEQAASTPVVGEAFGGMPPGWASGSSGCGCVPVLAVAGVFTFWSDGLKSRLARGEGKPRYKYTLRAPRGNTQSEEKRITAHLAVWAI